MTTTAPANYTRHSALLAFGACALLAGCIDTTPSNGRCTGTLGGREVELAMDPETSQFHRDDDVLLDDDAPFVMSYGAGALSIDGELADMPAERDLGTHSTSGELFHAFSITSPPDVSVDTGSMTLTTAAPTRMSGTMDLLLTDGSALRCTFDLRRAYELDTDD